MSLCTCTRCGAPVPFETLAEIEPACTRCEPPGAELAWAGYRLLGRLGVGGMGEVWRVRAPDGALRALKVLRSESAGAPARFAREAEALSRLEHPGIVRVLAHGEHEGRPYLVQELALGPTLREELRGGPLPLRRALDIAAELATALAAAHRAGVVHRDLKPENVILAPDGGARLLDFGVARIVDGAEDARLTRTGDLIGTPCYMAPEQILEEPEAVGPAADAHALGLLLYEMLSGVAPFAGKNLLQTLRWIESARPEELTKLRAEVPATLASEVHALLAKDPAERPADLLELARRWRAASAAEAAPTRAHSVRIAGLVALAFLAGGALGVSVRSPGHDAAGPVANAPAEGTTRARLPRAQQLLRAVEAAADPEGEGALALRAALDGAEAGEGPEWLRARGLAELRLGAFHAAEAALAESARAGFAPAESERRLAELWKGPLLDALLPGATSAAGPTEEELLSLPASAADRAAFLALRYSASEQAVEARAMLAEASRSDPEHLPCALLAAATGRRAAEELGVLAGRFDWRSPERHLVRAAAAVRAGEARRCDAALELADAAGATATVARWRRALALGTALRLGLLLFAAGAP